MKHRKCKNCGSSKYYCKGLCKSCYTKQLVPSRWSRESDCCKVCKSSETPHQAKGLCNRCYNTWEGNVLCACGCGLPTSVYRGEVKKFRKGHWLRVQREGSIFQEAHKKRFTGKNNPQYGKFGKNHPAYGHETSPEVREMRRQTRLRMASNRGKVTDIESILSNLLEELNLTHTPQSIMYKKFAVDEFLPEFGLIIEAFGGYWHSDPRRFKELSSVQLKISKKDKSKVKYLTTCGHRVLILWELELKKDQEWCKKEILSAIQNSRFPFVQDSIQGESFYSP